MPTVVWCWACVALLIPRAGQDPGGDRDEESWRDVRKLIEQLGAEEAAARDAAEQALQGLGATIKPELEEALRKARDKEVRTRLSRLLRTINFQRILGDGPGKEFVEAVGVLDRIRVLRRYVYELNEREFAPADAAEVAGAILTDATDEASKKGAIRAVTDAGIRLGGWVCAALANDRSAAVRAQALWGLGRLRSSVHSDLCGRKVTDPDEEVRKHAVWALGEMKAASFLSAIEGRLKDRSPQVRAAAAEAVAALGARESAVRVSALLDDPSIDVRTEAIHALGDLGAKEFAERIGGFLDSKDPRERAAAASAGGKLSKALSDKIATLLSDPVTAVRRSAVSGLTAADPVAHSDSIAKLLKDEDFLVKILAADTLLQFSAERYATQVCELLRDNDIDVRRHVAKGLVKRGVVAAIEPLKRAAEMEEDEWTANAFRQASRELEAIRDRRR
jgi:HEAT repeat protein